MTLEEVDAVLSLLPDWEREEFHRRAVSLDLTTLSVKGLVSLVQHERKHRTVLWDRAVRAALRE